MNHDTTCSSENYIFSSCILLTTVFSQLKRTSSKWAIQGDEEDEADISIPPDSISTAPVFQKSSYTLQVVFFSTGKMPVPGSRYFSRLSIDNDDQ
ncbi:hypothetical protein BDR05DRAFT_297530 [Suillus weaverae]|nr:hypothetical protein BDR05DRAFT_297530 [Suillus weaverae]